MSQQEDLSRSYTGTTNLTSNNSLKQSTFSNTQIKSVIFKYENSQSQINIEVLQESGLIKEILNQQNSYLQQPLQMILPKWVSKQIFEIFEDYLNTKTLDIWKNNQIELSDQVLQRLLWVGDYFQIDKFQGQIITDVLIPRIQVQNCLIFLNEAFKKLKACEDSQDIWYMLLNTGMNFTAKNLLKIYQVQPKELQKINQKILEEIIERTLKYNKNKPEFDQKEMVNVLLQVRKKTDFLDLLNHQHKQVVNKKINFQNHPSISWKLANISSIVNKETNPFKFNDFQWKLAAKMESQAQNISSNTQITQNQKVLRIYLRLEKQNKEALQQLEEQSESPNSQKIIAIYFLLKINEKKTQNLFTIKHIIVDKSPQILMCQFPENEFSFYENKKLEFTVFLNTDYIYSLLLNYFSRNWVDLYKQSNLEEMKTDDLEIIVKATQGDQKKQELVSLLILEWIKKGVQDEQDLITVFKALNYKFLSTNYLITTFLNNPQIKSKPQVFDYINEQTRKKSVVQLSSSRNNYLSPQPGSSSNIQYSQARGQSQNSKDQFSYQYGSGLKKSTEFSNKLNSKQENFQVTSQQGTSPYLNKRVISPSPQRLQKQDSKGQNQSGLDILPTSNLQQRENLHKQGQNNLNNNSQLNKSPNQQRLNSEKNYDFNHNNLSKNMSGYYDVNNKSFNKSPINDNNKAKDTSPLGQQKAQGIQQITSHTNSRIGYSPNTNLQFQNNNLKLNNNNNQPNSQYNSLSQQNYIQSNFMQNNNGQNNNLNNNSSSNLQLGDNKKQNDQTNHSKSGIVLVNNTFGGFNNQYSNQLGLNNYNSNNTNNQNNGNSNSAVTTNLGIGLINNSLSQQFNQDLPLNKLDQIRGAKQQSTQGSQFNDSNVKTQQDIKPQNNFSLSQQKSNFNQLGDQKLPGQKNFSGSQVYTTQNDKNKLQQSANLNINPLSSLAYNKNLFNFHPLTNKQSNTQNSTSQLLQSTQPQNQQNNNANNINKNNGVFQSTPGNYQQFSNSRTDYTVGGVQVKNNLTNKFGIQQQLEQEKEKRKQDLNQKLDLLNFVIPNTWLSQQLITQQ